MAVRSKSHWSIQVAFLLLAIAASYHLFQAGASLLTVAITWGITQGICWQLILHGIRSQGLDQGESTTGWSRFTVGWIVLLSLILLPAVIALLMGYFSIAGSLCVLICYLFGCSMTMSDWVITSFQNREPAT